VRWAKRELPDEAVVLGHSNGGRILMNFTHKKPQKRGNPPRFEKNPRIAGKKCPPLSSPSLGGKIRLPAPKKMANSIKPTTKLFLVIKHTQRLKKEK